MPRWKTRTLLCCGSLAACGGRAPTSFVVTTDSARAVVSDRMLSFAVDTSQVVGSTFWSADGDSAPMSPVARYDFTRPVLGALVDELSPAYLRIGGTDADRTYYDLSASPVTTPPAGYKWVLDHTIWDAAADFARTHDLELLFALNAGAGPRDAKGAWTSDNARALLSYAAGRQDPVETWELGNEINAYPFVFKITVTPEQYAADVGVARTLVDAVTPGAHLAGPADAYFPLAGELGSELPAIVQLAGAELDVVTWHYYPQQSTRCPAQLTPATPGYLLASAPLAEVETWAKQVLTARTTNAPKADVWLGETGNAQCGGAPGISNTFESSLWWLDQLGRLAALGVSVQVRQTLSGSDYGLIDDATLTPRPDYWASVLWKRLMGTTVLAVAPASSTAPKATSVYAHCAKGVTGGVAVVYVNYGDEPLDIDVGLPGSHDEYVATPGTSDLVTSSDVKFNGELPGVDASGHVTLARPRSRKGAVSLPARSYAFATFAHAGAAACH